MEVVTQTVLVILLVFLNGFFAASEYALVALRKTHVDEMVKKGDVLAKLIQQALNNREDFISATQLGTTIVSLILGWVGEPAVSRLFYYLFFFLPKGAFSFITHFISVSAAFLSLTLITIVIGELVPKTIALQKTEMVALVTIGPLSLFVKIFRPFIIFLKTVGNKTLRLIKLNPSVNDHLDYTKEELQMVLNQVGETGTMHKDDITIVENVFKLSDKPIKQMMTPRSEMITINAHSNISKIREQLDQRYSRFPVYKGNVDNIIGFVHVKDLYFLEQNPGKDKKLIESNIIRKIINVPEAKKANEVLLDMRKRHVHLTAVYNEFGVIVGVVTLEDIVESLVGEIQDEFDKPIADIKRNSDGSYLIDGAVSLEKIQKRFHLPIKGQGYTTIGGLVFGLLGREPKIGDKVLIAQKFFEVKSISGKRIKELILAAKKTND